MSWSLKVGTVAGTAVRIHFTFLLFLIWIGAAYYRQGGATAAYEGVAFVSLLFLCVLLHEFGHIFAARRYGVKTPDVTLWPFGGIANLERIPEKPTEELVVAIAGPLVNVAIAAVLILLLGATVDPAHLANIEDPKIGMVAKLAGANLFLAVFNMIPAFPMDGGRVLRALLAIRLGFARATEIAASIGQGFAIALGVLGIFTNPMLVIIAIFVFLAASGEAGHVQLREVSRGALVADAMITKFETLRTDATVNDAVECLIRTTQKEFPVVDGGGRLRGVLDPRRHDQGAQGQGPGDPGARGHAAGCGGDFGPRHAGKRLEAARRTGRRRRRRDRRRRQARRAAHGREPRRDDDGARRPREHRRRPLGPRGARLE